MQKYFERIFKQISSLTKIHLDSIGLNFDQAEEIDYFCFFIIKSICIQEQHESECYDIEFIEMMNKKYGRYDAQIFQLKKDTYQYYLLHALRNQSIYADGDPFMSIAYLLSDHAIASEYYTQINIILLTMTIKSIIKQSKLIINSYCYLDILRHNP